MTDITLSRLQAADRADVIASNIASKAHHHPWTAPVTDEAGFERWLEEVRGDTSVSLIARHLTGNEIVGVINFTQIVRGRFLSAYTGFYGMASHAGQGLMTQALRGAVDLAFNELGLHRLEANIQSGNGRSIALVQRVGFRKEGYSPYYLFIDDAWRGHERWAICREDL